MGNDHCSDILYQRSQKFYRELNRLDNKQTIYDNEKSLSEKVYLKVYLTQIENDYTYNIKLFDINKGQRYPLNEISDCKYLDKKSIILNSRVIIKYYFEKNQPLLIEITRKKSNSFQNKEINTTLGCIMGSRKNTFQKNVFFSLEMKF